MKFAFTSFFTISLVLICAASPSKADIIFNESSNLCIHPEGGSANPADNTNLVLHSGGCQQGESRLQFQLLPSGSIQHIPSGKCIHPAGGSANPEDNTQLVLHNGCNEARLGFRLVSGGIQHISSGKCIHPEGGTAALDTRLVLHAGCGEQRLAFAFRQISTVADPRAQASGIPSPIDGQPIEPGFNLGFGDDNRIAMRSNAYPWSAVGRVQIDGGGHCTGALIARDLVLTNAHCIFVDGQRRGVTFAPNYRNGQAPETVRGTFYSWGTSEPNKNRRADWAIIHLERSIGDRYGWFSSQALNYPELRGRTVTYVGYSTFGDETVEEFRNGETAQVHIGCQVRDVYPDQGVIHTDCDNGRGGSGGPIFIWQNNQPIIVAINAAEFRGESQVSFFTQNYTPRQGNIGVPTLTFGTAIREASYRANSGRFKPGFYSRMGMNPPGIIYFWPSPWDGGRTDVWCNVPNHSMYARHLNNIGSAMEVSNLATVQNTAKYWSQACSDDVFRHSRVQN